MPADSTSAAVKVRLTAKRCACCGEVKPVAEFYQRRGTCKTCHKRRVASNRATKCLSARAKWAAIGARNQAEAGQ